MARYHFCMAECAVCLNIINITEEAFIDKCFHRFHLKCIQHWTSIQKAHPGSNPDPSFAPSLTLTCPLCRQPYTSIIHTCVESSFSVLWVDPEAQARQAVAVGTQMHLSPMQLRRRSVYTTQQPVTLPQPPASTSQPSDAATPASSTSAAPIITNQGQGLPDSVVQHAATNIFETATMKDPAVVVFAATSDQVVNVEGPVHQQAAECAPGGANELLQQVKQVGTKIVPEEHRESAPPDASPAKRRRVAGPPIIRRAHSISDPVVESWMTRELQALLQEQDVLLLVAAAQGALHSTLPKAKPKGAVRGIVQRSLLIIPAGSKAPDIWPLSRPSAATSLPTRASATQPASPQLPPWHDTMIRAIAPLIGKFAEQFSQELHAFILSGLSIEAYDRQVFGRQTDTKPTSTGQELGSNVGQVGGGEARQGKGTQALAMEQGGGAGDEDFETDEVQEDCSELDDGLSMGVSVRHMLGSEEC